MNNDFYSLRDRYKEDMRPFYQRYLYFFISRHPLYKNYCLELARRFQSLVGYFLYEEGLPQSVYPHLLFEFQALTTEMISLGILKDNLLRRLENLRPQTQKTLNQIVQEAQAKPVEYNNALLEELKKYAFQSKFFILALVFYGIVAVASIKVFEILYLTPQ